MTKARKALQHYLKSKSLKLTRTRRLVFDEIVTTGKIHPNARDIYENLQEKGHKVSLATIYRTLNLLVKSGLVSEIDLGEAHAHYEPDIPHGGHGHLICLSCGSVQEFTNEEIRSRLKKISKKEKFQTDRFTIEVFGFCKNCQEK